MSIQQSQQPQSKAVKKLTMLLAKFVDTFVYTKTARGYHILQGHADGEDITKFTPLNRTPQKTLELALYKSLEVHLVANDNKRCILNKPLHFNDAKDFQKGAKFFVFSSPYKNHVQIFSKATGEFSDVEIKDITPLNF